MAKCKPEKCFFLKLIVGDLSNLIITYRFMYKTLMWPFYVPKGGIHWTCHKLALLNGIDHI